MKVGKKALSLLLAVIMIMSSVSVSFSVFAATTDTKDIYTAIVMHYDSLMEAIDKATKGDESKRDTSGVPVRDGSTWEVKRDTMNGGWLAVARAVASYAKGNVGTLKTYVDIVEKIKLDAQGYATQNGQPVADYKTILDYFKFGSTATGKFGTKETVTLKIGTGFDLLGFKDVASIEDKTYSSAELKFTPNGDIENGFTLTSADDISFSSKNFIDAGTDIGALKGVLEWCVGTNVDKMAFGGKDANDREADKDGRKTFSKWFNASELTILQLADITSLLALYDVTVAVAGFGYTEAQVWDHYVAPKVGKTYTETKAWYETTGARVEAEISAKAYKKDLDELMAKNRSVMTAEQLYALRDDVRAVIQKMDNDMFSSLVYEIVNEKEAGYIGSADCKVEKFLKTLGVEIGQAYAVAPFEGSIVGDGGNDFTLADKLAEYAAEADSILTSKDVELQEGQAWEDTPEYDIALAWVTNAETLISLIDRFVLDGATFADVAESKTADGNAITEELYKAVADKAGEISLDLHGKKYFEEKAIMDGIMSGTILTGRNYATIVELCSEFVLNYQNALSLSQDSSKAKVFNAVYPDGLDDYAKYVQTLKAAAAKAYYDSMNAVQTYVSEAGKVAYFNFESIISKAEAISSSSGAYIVVAEFLDKEPVYVPGEGDITKDQLSTLYNKIYSEGGYYNSALDFRTGLNNLRNLAYTNAANNKVVDKKILAYILRQENVDGSAYAWESLIGNVSVEEIRAFVNEIELVQQAGIETNLQGKITAGGIEKLMTSAVEDLDKILISNDLGTLLNSLTAKENEETGATVGFLGVWGQDYSFKNPDGTTTTVKAGDPCKNLREFLINLIVGLFWGGSIQTMLLTEVAGKTVGSAVYNLAGNPTDLSILGKKDNWQWLPELLHMGLPTMPHDYVQNWTNPITGDTNKEVEKISDYLVDWSKFFTGEAYGAKGHAEYDYTMFLHVLDKAPFDTKFSTSGREARTYWAPFTYSNHPTDSSKKISNGERDEYRPGDTVGPEKALDAGYFGGTLPIWYENASGTRRATAAAGYEPVYFDSKKAWHINDWDDFYRTFATATCGLHVPLAELLTHKASTGKESNIYGEADILNLDATVKLTNNGDSLYDRLFIPLYRLLGIEGFYNVNTNPGGYHNKSDILYASGTYAHNNNMGVNSSSIQDSGVTLWKYVLEPIVYFLENVLFVSPVKTIAELLPNLLTMLEYDQLMPKLRNIQAHIRANVKPVGISVNIDVLTLNLSDIVVPLLTGLGLTEDALKNGINGLLGALLGGERTTVKPDMNNTESKWLMKVEKVTEEDEFGNKVTTNKTSETEAASWKGSDGNIYYLKNPGLLTSALYGAMLQADDPETTENEALNNAFLDWMFIKGGTKAELPLTIPVNRFMATGSLKGGDHPNTESITIPGVYGSVTNYHIYAEAGTAVLVLLRWLLNDGTLDMVMPLLNGLIKPTVNADGSTSSILDTIIPIVEGQADSLMAAILCLLNDYVIDVEAFQDPAQNISGEHQWGKWNAERTEFTPYLDENGQTNFKVGTVFQKYLAEGNTLITDEELAKGYGTGFNDADLIAKADLAVKNVDKTIIKLVPTLLVALEDTLMGVDAIRDLGFAGAIEEAKKAIAEDKLEEVTLESIVGDTLLGNNLMDIIMNLLFGNGLPTKAKDASGNAIQAHNDGVKMPFTYTDGEGNTTTRDYYITAGSEKAPLVYDEKGDPEIVRQVNYMPVLDKDGNETGEYTDQFKSFVVNEGLLGDLFGDPNSILNKVLEALGQFNLDASPVGFYDSFTSETAGKNTNLAAWLKSQAERFSGKTLNSVANVRTELKKMTWGDIRAPKNTKWLSFAATADVGVKFDEFLEFVCDVLYPLNPILSFLLSGQDIILFDELKLQGENGYSRGIVAILEALRLDSACMSQNSFDNFVYSAIVGQDPTIYKNENNVNVDNLSKGTIEKDGVTITKRFAVTKNSPLKPLMVAIKQLLVGVGEEGDANYEAGILDAPLTVLFTRLPNVVYNLYLFQGEDGKNTCNLSIAVKNLIAPVTKILDVVDPILARLVALDINELLDSFLDIEALLNNLINSLVAKEGQTSNAAIFDFGMVAADSATINRDAKTYRYGMDKFTRFEGSPGRFFITIIRALFAGKDIANFIGDLIATLAGCYDPAQNVTPEQQASSERIIRIINGVIDKLCNSTEDLQGGMPIDYVSSIIIDIFTDYESADGDFYFYEIINRLGDITPEEQQNAMSDDMYGIKHNGYDWANKPKDENGKLLFTEEKVNKTVENLDYVIRKAVPEVLATLQANGVLGEGLLSELDGDDGLWGLIKALALDFALNDDAMTWIANLIIGLFGKSGDITTSRTIQQALKAAGFDMTFNAFLYEKDKNGNIDKSKKTALYDYFTYGFKKENGNLKDATPDNTTDYMYYLEDGTVAELTFVQIYNNHAYDLYEFDEDGVLVLDANGQPKKSAVQVQITREATDDQGAPITEYKYIVLDEDGKETTEVIWLAEAGKTEISEDDGLLAVTKKITAATEDKKIIDENGNEITVYNRALRSTAYPQVTDADGKFAYTYTDYEGTVKTEYFAFEQLKVLDSGRVDGEGKKIYYALTPVYHEYDASNDVRDWAWGIDDPDLVKPDGVTLRDEFNAKKVAVVNTLWSVLEPFAMVFSTLFADDALRLFDTLNIEGGFGYDDYLLPLLRAFGLDSIIEQLGAERLAALETKDAEGKRIEHLMTKEEYMDRVYNDDGTIDPAGVGFTVKNVINYIFYFVEILCNYPVETLANALPTLAYFLYADGLTSILNGVLVPVTTLLNRLQTIIKIDINTIGSGLIDGLATNNWNNFQLSLENAVFADPESSATTTDEFNITYSLLSLLTNLEFDLSGIVGKDDTYGGKYGIALFLNKENEHMAKQLLAQADELEKNGGATAEQISQMRQQARDCRAGTLKQFLKAIAALGDPVSEHEDEANEYIKENYADYVYISSTGTVHVSKAEVLMFLLDFIFENNTLKEVIGSLLGHDITDINTSDADLLDTIITNVFNNPNDLVALIVALFTEYNVKEIVTVELADIEAENHFEFYEDAGYDTHEEVLEHNKTVTNEAEKITEISRVKTSATIDNLDALVGKILNLSILKDMLAKADDPKTAEDERGIFNKLFGITTDDTITLKGIVDAVFETYLYDDKGLNSIMDMLIGLLGGEGSAQIINIVFDILAGAGYDLTPDSFKANVPQLAATINKAQDLNKDGKITWNEVVKANSKYQYVVKNDKGEVLETLYADEA
ncbi:MAG: hypothetical protein IIX36_05415, partial [Clostridia bacterium]|nr:hypothetical protein [Clostridia bacterium]